MGTQLLRLALLLAVLQYAAVQGLSKEHMAELMANDGRYFLRTYHKDSPKYLTGQEEPLKYGVTITNGPPGNLHHWRFIPKEGNKIAIRARNGRFLRRDNPIDLQITVDTWELWNPVKNPDGSWSFRSERSYWLSAYDQTVARGGYENKKCEHWWLEPWKPTDTIMRDLRRNNGVFLFWAQWNGKYLNGQENNTKISQRKYVSMVEGMPVLSFTWKIEKKNEVEVSIQANNGLYLSNAKKKVYLEAYEGVDWEKKNDGSTWTPVMNGDGTWSFRTREGFWLSAHSKDGTVYAMEENQACERWQLFPWRPRRTNLELFAFHIELLANGGRRLLRAYNNKYLTGQEDTSALTHRRNEVTVEDGVAGPKQQWIIRQVNEREVALMASNGDYIRHLDTFLAHVDLTDGVDEWETWTAVKNQDGSWSFRNFDKWLSATPLDNNLASTQNLNLNHERFWLEDW